MNEEHMESIPFIPTESYQVIENRVLYHFMSPSSSKISLYLYFVGNIGVGKSTALLHLKKELEKKDFRVAYLSKEHKTEASILRAMTGSYQSYSVELSKKWNETRSIVFFDVPDTANRTHLVKMGSVMQELMVKFKTSIIVVFNKQQYQRFQSLGTILGKYSPYALTPFTIDDTMNMVYKRLERARKKPHKDPLYPFTNEIIERIHKIAQGNPRNIVLMCSLLIESDKGSINLDLVKKVTKDDYIMRILESSFPSEYRKNTLKDLIGVIENDFNGCAPSQTELIRVTNEKLGWSRITIKRRIKELEKTKILIIDRNEAEPWRMDHRLVNAIDD
jgi:DNA polymerase III delta prime subunit